MTSRFILFAIASILGLSLNSLSFAKTMPSPVELLLKEKGKSVTLQQRKTRHDKSVDEIDLDLKTNKARCEEIEKILTDNYGPAISTRRNIRIWELPNTDNVNGQSKIITIMAGEEDGRYFVRLDRRGPTKGNNPRLDRNGDQKSTTSLSKSRSYRAKNNRSYERD